VPKEHPAPRDPVGIDDERPRLPVHLGDGRPGGVGVVVRHQVPAARVTAPELEVRHVDVHDAVEEGQAVERIVPTRVVDDGEAEPPLDRHRQGLEHLGHHVFGRDEVDVVAAQPLQVQHEGGNDVGRRGPGARPRPEPLADIEVLAEDAAQVAVAEEDRARAVPAAQARLFSEVREGAGDHRVAAGLAGGPPVPEPVDVAIARTGPAARERVDGTPGAVAQLAAGEA
jgi:hypothetical protein